MRLDYPRKRKEVVAAVLLGFSAFLGVMILYKVGGFFVASAKAEKVVNRAIAQSEPDSNDVKKSLDKSKEIAGALTKSNLFSPPPPKQHPVSVVLGILGNEAFINGKWYKAGDRVGDANIVAIEPTLVRIEWDGKEKVFQPIEAAVAQAPGRPRPGGETTKREGGGEGRPGVVVEVRTEGGQGFDARAFGPGFGGMRERWEGMSEEQRRALRERMRDRMFGGGRGRGPGGDRGEFGGRGRR